MYFEFDYHLLLDRYFESFSKREKVRMLPSWATWLTSRTRQHEELHLRRKGGGLLDTNQHHRLAGQKYLR